MIAWVKERQEILVIENLKHKMEKELKEVWLAKYCALCHMFLWELSEYMEFVCSDQCPLVNVGHCCRHDFSLWEDVEYAESVEDWLEKAERMLKLLEDCKKIEKF